MIAKCITDCAGDFWDITIGKEYEVLEDKKNYMLYICDNKEVTEERYLIKDDSGTNYYYYPATCFEIISC